MKKVVEINHQPNSTYPHPDSKPHQNQNDAGRLTLDMRQIATEKNAHSSLFACILKKKACI